MSSKVNSDLQKERNTCTFKIEELTHLLDDGATFTERRRDLGKDFIISIVFINKY